MMQVIDERVSNMERIVSRMTRNQWLTREEQRLSDDDMRLSREQERLAKVSIQSESVIVIASEAWQSYLL